MNNTVIISTISMAGLGLFFASVLAVVNQKLRVKEDPKTEALAGVLPHVNCGACGFANCHQYAEALAEGKVQPDRCKAGGKAVLENICAILGIKAEVGVKEIAVIHCGADISKRKKKAKYTGIKTCVAAHNMFGGETLCRYGCLGYGDCVKACPFGAITLVNGLPKVDRGKCTACGQCTLACPRGLITIEKMEADGFLYIACRNHDKGGQTRKTCSVGCIACGLCQRLTEGVFSVEDNLARVKSAEMENITNKDEVIKKCPTKCIAKI